MDFSPVVLLRVLFLITLLMMGTVPTFSGVIDFSAVEELLETAVEDKVFPGSIAAIGWGEGKLWVHSVGYFDYEQSHLVDSETIYDLASLTKVVGTTATMMRLVAEEKLDVTLPVVHYLPEFSADSTGEERGWREELTVEQLLRHRGGLASWKPFYRSVDGYENLLKAVIETPLEVRPGTRYRYSDLGFILLGEIASRAGGESLAELEKKLVFEPLRMESTLRNPAVDFVTNIPPTERDPDGEGFIHGIVHDENARAGGGVTGHAGLFSTAGDLALFAQELLRAAKGESEYFSKEVYELFAERRDDGSNRGLGWVLASGRGSSGSLLSQKAIGHTGFTGTSIWIDPEREIYLILLTNRVHPTRDNQKLGPFQAKFADAAVRALPVER